MPALSPDLDRLKLLFSRTQALPELNLSTRRLVQVIEEGEASANELEKILTCDPGLAATVLKVANTKMRATQEPITTLRLAIMVMGQQAIRTLAVSLGLQQMLTSKTGSSLFDAHGHIRHSLTVAYLARYVFARRNMKGPFQTSWSNEEVFGAALLHDLGIPLLACVAPEVFTRCYGSAQRSGLTIGESFYRTFGERLGHLAAVATTAWGLPKVFTEVLPNYREPWNYQEEFVALSCLNYADYLAVQHGVLSEKWTVTPEIAWEVQEEVGLTEAEIERVMPHVALQAAEHLDNIGLKAS